MVKPRAAGLGPFAPSGADWDLGWTPAERKQKPPPALGLPAPQAPPPEPPALPPAEPAAPAEAPTDDPPHRSGPPVGLWVASGAVVVTLAAALLGIAGRSASKEPLRAVPALVQVCRESGRLPAADCPRVKREFPEGEAPIVACHVHAPSPVSMCAATGLRAAAECPKTEIRLFPYGKAPRRECPGHVSPKPGPPARTRSAPRPAVRPPAAAEPRRAAPQAPEPRRPAPEPRPPARRARYCGVCGSAAGGRFCGTCGSKL